MGYQVWKSAIFVTGMQNIQAKNLQDVGCLDLHPSPANGTS